MSREARAARRRPRPDGLPRQRARSPSPRSQRLAAQPARAHRRRRQRPAAPGRPVTRRGPPTPVDAAARAPGHPAGPDPAAAARIPRRSPRSSRCGRTSPCSRTTARSSRRRCSTCRHGALNLHPSALPRFRGAAPMPAAILAGDPETAVTLMRMDAGLDTGPIVGAGDRVPLDGTEHAPELERRLARGRRRTCSTARSRAGSTASCAAVPQADDGVVLTRPLRREDGRLDPIAARRRPGARGPRLPAVARDVHRGWRRAARRGGGVGRAVRGRRRARARSSATAGSLPSRPPTVVSCSTA